MELFGYADNLSIVMTASNTEADLGKFFDHATEHFESKDEVDSFTTMMDPWMDQLKGSVFQFKFKDDAQMGSFVQYYGVAVVGNQAAVNKNVLMTERGIEDRYMEQNGMFTIAQVAGIASHDPWDTRSMHEKMNAKAPAGYKSRNDEMMTSDDSFSMEPAVKAAMGAHLLDNQVNNVVASVIRKVNGDENNAILKMKFNFISKNIEVKWDGTTIIGDAFINLLSELATSTKYKMFFKAGDTPTFEVELMDGSFSSVALMNSEKSAVSSVFPHDHKAQQ